jgi:AmpE protein
MIFLSTLVATGLMFGWHMGAGIQQDKWYLTWLRFLQAHRRATQFPVILLLLAIGLPALVLVFVIFLVAYFFSSMWLFLIYVPVLMYSLGRGKLRDEVNDYLSTSARGDNVVASRWVDQLRGAAASDDLAAEVDDWQKLHTQALEVISYRSFERLFAVLFWFFIFGAVGALVYRLSVIYAEQTTASSNNKLAARRWLWLLEWPGVRILALSWALVGNFDSCYSVLRRDLFDKTLSSMALLSRSLRGALGMTPAVSAEMKDQHLIAVDVVPLAAPIISGINTEPDSFGLINASLSLFSRALLLWICTIAVITLIT